jgi:hypothetical protein
LRNVVSKVRTDLFSFIVIAPLRLSIVCRSQFNSFSIG